MNQIKKSFFVYETFILFIHLLSILVAFGGPLLIVGYQCFHWLKFGEWLPLPVSVIGLTEWKGLAKLPLSLVVLISGIIVSRFISENCYPEEKDYLISKVEKHE